MSGPEGGPSNNANLGHSRGGRGQNAYSRGRGGGVGPAQRGNDGPGGRNGGRGGGRGGQSFDRIVPVQQPRRQPDVQYFLNNGGQRGQGQQYGPAGHVGLSLPPGLPGGVPNLQFGSIQPTEVFGAGQQANAAQVQYMNRGQHGVPPQHQQPPPQQQQKLQHQQHAAKMPQGVGQQAGMVMGPGMHAQGPPGVHAHPQMLMQGHQGQPNQPQFPPAQPQFTHSMFPVPPGLMIPNQFQQQQQQQQQQYVRPAVRPPVAKRVLSLVDPTTQKPVDIASSTTSANGVASRPRTANAQEAKPAPVRSLSEASKRQPPAPSSEAKSQPARVTVKAVTVVKPAEAVPDKKPADADGAGKKDLVKAMAAASISDKKAPEAIAPAQSGPASAAPAKAAISVPEDKIAPAPVAAPQAKATATEKRPVPEDKPAPVSALAQPAIEAPAVVQPGLQRPIAIAAPKAEQPQASAQAKELPQPSAAPTAVAPSLSYAARVKQAAAPKQPPVPAQEAQVPAKEVSPAAPEEIAPEPKVAKSAAPAEAGEKKSVPVDKLVPLPPTTPQIVESKAAEKPAPVKAEFSVPSTASSPAAAADDAAAVGNGEASVQPATEAASAAHMQPDKEAEAPAAKDEEAKGGVEAAGEKSGVPAFSAKAKRKALLAKADTQGTKGSMLDAFVTPPPAKSDAEQDSAPKAATADQPAQTPAKTELTKEESEGFEDWEAAAEGMATPSAAVAAERSAAARAAVVDASDCKRYTRDWLMTYQNQCMAIPAGLEDSDVMRGDGNGGGPPSGGRAGPGGGFDSRGPRGSGGHMPPAMGPPGIGLGAGGAAGLDSKRWDRGTMRGPEGMGPPPGPPGMGGRGMMGPPGPPMGGRGGGPRVGGIDGAKWQRGLQPPPPPPGLQASGFGPPRGYGGPAITLHKTENRYQLGRLVSDDPDEEKRQKEFKSFLNKITPDNYETIRDKIIAVGMQSPATLQGLIDQVFDKALLEPGFSEIYATLCFDLNQSLPSFKDESGEEGAMEITFRRVLLNKCQEEFEEGDAAMKAVEAREKAEQEKADAKAEGKDEEEKEDGEITVEERQQKQRDDLQAAQLELKARRRALGNIQFIGQLYKQKMLTEKIMHSCIITLLGEVENPKAEDVECLCKLLVTIGGMLDANPVKNKDRMDAYFSRLGRLATHPKLESRHKFMVQDVIELRAHNWVARRKVEGPKKIEDIHKDARAELQRQRMAPMPDRRRGGPPMDRGPMPQRPPERSRMDDRVDAPIRPMNRAPSQEWLTGSSLRPGGGAPRSAAEPTVSLRPGGPGAAGAGAGARSGSSSSLRTPSPARDVSPAPVPPPAQEPEQSAEEVKELPRDIVEGRAKLLAVEYLSNADVKELMISLQELQQQKADFVYVVEGFFNGTFEAKNVDRNRLLDLLLAVTSAPESGVKPDVVERALKAVLDILDQTMVDVPFAPTLVGEAIGALAAKGVVSLKSLAQHALTAESLDAEPREEGEDTALVDGGGAVKLIAAALKRFKEDTSLQQTAKAWRDTGIDLSLFMASFEREEAGALSKLLVKYDLQFLYPLAGVEQYLPDALKQGESADKIIAWMDQSAGDAADVPEFAHFVTAQVLQSSLGDGKGVVLDAPALSASSDQVRILHRVSGAEAPKEVQQAVIAATVEFFTQSSGRKGLLRRLLTDLHAAEVVSEAALQTWRYNTNDIEAVKDVSTWLDELRESDEQDDE